MYHNNKKNLKPTFREFATTVSIPRRLGIPAERHREGIGHIAHE
jgi:hypothetical protein